MCRCHALSTRATPHAQIVVVDERGQETSRVGAEHSSLTLGGKNSRQPVATLSWPKGIAVHGDLIYVCDTGHHCVKVRAAPPAKTRP